MALELTGKLLQKLPVQSGLSAKGAWSKQEFILEIQENFPRKVCISVWGPDKVAELEVFSEGETIKASVNLESRSYNDRWYTDVRAWRIEKTVPLEKTDSAIPPIQTPSPESNSWSSASDSGLDDLPF